MAMTRKSLKAMGLTDEQIDSIIEMHTETVDGLKDKLKAAEEKANKLDDVQKELDGLKANSGDDWKSKYEKEHSDFESYKKGVTEKETKAAKRRAELHHGPRGRAAAGRACWWHFCWTGSYQNRKRRTDGKSSRKHWREQTDQSRHLRQR